MSRRPRFAIRDNKPDSISELAKITQRAGQNVVRTLDKLVALGLVHYVATGRRKAPRVSARKITIEIDPYSNGDVISLTPTRPVARSDDRAPSGTGGARPRRPRSRAARR